LIKMEDLFFAFEQVKHDKIILDIAFSSIDVH
jgi:hypothetical protein